MDALAYRIRPTTKYSSAERLASIEALQYGFAPRRPRRPTNAPPGSPAKLRELARRAQRGEALWHPLDATVDGLPMATYLE